MLDILFEDDACLVVNKPAGLLTQAPIGIDSLEFRIKKFLAEREGASGDVYLGVPHRLDRPASGAIVFAKNLKAAQRISKQFETRRVEKTYWGLVAGEVQPTEATWLDHLKKIDGDPRTIVVDPSDPAGRNAILHYRVVHRSPHAPREECITRSVMPTVDSNTLLEITLETGRTHQIRVQCASRGHPLLGDELYGSREPFGPWRDDERERLIALHARTLKFWRHELRGYISVVAPLPAYWRDAGVDEMALMPLQS